jgi:hypothetical protein
MTAYMWRWRNRMGVSCGRVMSACIMPCMPSTPWYGGLQIINHDGRESLGQRHSSQRSSVVSPPFYTIHPVMCYPNRSMHKHPFAGQASHPRHRASPRVEQPMARICVRLAPLPHVFRHPAPRWPPYPPGIFLLHLQAPPDGRPPLSALSLESHIRELSLTLAHP